MKKRTVFTVLALAFTAFIFYNSAKPAVESAETSGFFAKWALQFLARFNMYVEFGLMDTIIRKIAHLTEFFVQSVLVANCFSGRYRKRIVYVLFFGLLTACTDEFIQLFFEGRGGLVSDIFIDFAGTAMGTAICGIFRRR